MAKITLTDIQSTLQQDGWTVISDTYTNLDTEMTFECNEGHQVLTTWKKLRNKRECPVCKTNVFANTSTAPAAKPKGTTRIMALDQASKTTGFAIFDDNKLVHYGTFSNSSSDDIKRFAAMREWLISMINNWQPDFIGIEGIQFQEEDKHQKLGVTVFQTLARLQGIMMLTCYEAKVPYEICSTNTWRHFCGVKGKYRADKKRSMQLIAKQLYDITVSEDEADAIGIGQYLSNFVKQSLAVDNWEI